MASGRVERRSRSRSNVPASSRRKLDVVNLVEEVKKINGTLNKAGSPTPRGGSGSGNVKVRKSGSNVELGGRSAARAALLCVGMGLSIGAALLLSSSSSISYEQLLPQVIEQFDSLRAAVRDSL